MLKLAMVFVLLLPSKALTLSGQQLSSNEARPT